MSKKSKTKDITLIAILSAIIAVVSFVPLKTLGLEITFSMVPVAVGAIVLGPVGGAILGTVFGLISFIQCFGYSALGVALLGVNPFFTFIMCVLTRTLAGYLTGLVYHALKTKDNLGVAVASLLAPVFNTVFFMSVLVLFFYNVEPIKSYVATLGAANPFVFIILFVGVNAVAEIVAGAILAFPISKAVKKYIR